MKNEQLKKEYYDLFENGNDGELDSVFDSRKRAPTTGAIFEPFENAWLCEFWAKKKTYVLSFGWHDKIGNTDLNNIEFFKTKAEAIKFFNSNKGRNY